MAEVRVSVVAVDGAEWVSLVKVTREGRRWAATMSRATEDALRD
jgi:hypothetical protein